LVARILARTIRGQGGCLLWVGAAGEKGYGRIRFNGRLYSPHRVVLEHRLGRRLLRHEDTCHRCDTPRCVDGDHLFAGTRQDNVHDMFSKGRAALPNPELSRKARRANQISWVNTVRYTSTESRACELCPIPIGVGDRYYDRKHGRRAHVACGDAADAARTTAQPARRHGATS
jgi:hypothetical protein